MIKKWLSKMVSKPRGNAEFDAVFERLFQESGGCYDSSSVSSSPSYAQIKAMEPRDKAMLLMYLVHQIVVPIRYKVATTSHEKIKRSDGQRSRCSTVLMETLLRSKLEFEDEEIIRLFQEYREQSKKGVWSIVFTEWPIGFTAIQLEKHVKAKGLSECMAAFLDEAIQWEEFNKDFNGYGANTVKAKARLLNVRHVGDDESAVIPPYEFQEEDVFSQTARELTAKLPDDLSEVVNSIYYHAVTASSGKPSQKWLKTSKLILSDISAPKYKAHIHSLLQILIQGEPTETTETYNYGSQEHSYTTYVFLKERSALLVKGLVWTMSQFHDQKTLDTLAQLAERAFKKIPGVGPTCAGVGNACIYSLANSKGLTGLSHLTRLKLKVTQNNTRKLIQKYIDDASEKLGITSSALEEMAVPDFGLGNGELTHAFDDYQLKVSLTGVGKTKMEWFTPEGKLQKSVPAFVKAKKSLADRLKHIRAQAKQMQKYSSAQRDRIDRCYLDNRTWTYEEFIKYYHDHGLVGFIARKMIWVFQIDGEIRAGIWREDAWYDHGGEPIYHLEKTTEIRLWHPLMAKEKEVLAWRDLLDEWQIQQPMKQAYREVYILTDAEVNTCSYSNRMAAHLLKQHQFNALAGVRGWKYSLLGAYDDGRDGETATLPIPAYQLTAEYWINELHVDDGWNDAGIYNYIATDQVRFTKDGQDVVDLVDVPELVFSEVMRDVDLFVGVCSVGNDPEWNDRGGVAEYRDYWTSYSFGNLTEMAKTRRTILERLLPRLKHRDVMSIDGKFLRVKGHVREYKIHIGSTNILMEPNDQYLCIVPARGKSAGTDKIFLPFEGDRGLSLVLSKAIMLAEDDKITDATILSQIKR